MPSLSLELLDELVPDRRNWKVFVETGTYHAGTTVAMQPAFEQIHTVELSRSLWAEAVKNHSAPNVTFHLGNSVDVFKGLLPQLDQPTMFFLDGHWSCGETARGVIEVPLLEEIYLINRLLKTPALVIIDDLRLFGRGPASGEAVDWTQINTSRIQEIVKSRLIDWQERPLLDKAVMRLNKRRPCHPDRQ